MTSIGKITAGRDDIRLDDCGLHLPENMGLEDWQRVGERLRDTQQSLMWWVGDWLRFGERKHGVTYADAAALTGYKEQSLRSAVWLSGQFDVLMRINKLTWHHHRHAAALPPAKRTDALQRAVDEGLSTRALKALVDEIKRDLRTPAPIQKSPDDTPAAPPAEPIVSEPAEKDVQPAPEPAPDSHGHRKLTYDALADTADGLREDLDEAKTKIKALKAERDDYKVKWQEAISDDDLGRKLGNAQRQRDTAKGRLAELQSKNAVQLRRINAQEAELKKLRAERDQLTRLLLPAPS